MNYPTSQRDSHLPRILWLQVLCLAIAPFNAYGVEQNIRYQIAADSAVRVTEHNSPLHSDVVWLNGVDAIFTFSSESGDFATVLAQVYLASLSNVENHPSLFSSPNDTEVTFRNFYVDYTRNWERKLNLRAGHFELPFGLEQHIDTNGTLRQYTTLAPLGLKLDWGVSVYGTISDFDYQVAWTAGSGNDWPSSWTSNDVYSGRIGTRLDQPWGFGLSYLKTTTNLPENSAAKIERRRAAVDFSFYRRHYGVVAEVSNGNDGDVNHQNTLLEVNWQASDTTQLLYAQHRSSRVGKPFNTSSEQNLAIGYKSEPNNQLTASAEFTHVLSSDTPSKRNNLLKFQLRYRLER